MNDTKATLPDGGAIARTDGGAIARTESALIPAPRAFDTRSGNWSIYQERLEEFFIAQGIDDVRKKKATLISLIGDEAYGELKNLCAPDAVSAKSYAQLCQLLAPQYARSEAVHFERKTFWLAKSQEAEPINQLVLRLKGLANSCKFGANYNAYLLEKLVSLQEGRALDRLCEEDETLSLDQAIKIITRIEGQSAQMARRKESDVFAMRGKEPAAQLREHRGNEQRAQSNSTHRPILKQQQNDARGRRYTRSGRVVKCLHCGGTNHHMSMCLHQQSTCYTCQQKGHIAPVCPKRPVYNKTHYIAASKGKPTGQRRRTNSDDELSSDLEHNLGFDLGSDSEVSQLNQVTQVKNENSQYNCIVAVNGRELEFQIDTGAGISAISAVTYANELAHVQLHPSSAKIFGYTGERLHIVGEIKVQIKVNSMVTDGTIYVVHEGGPPILGRNLLNKLNFKYEFVPRTNAWGSVHNLLVEANKSAHKICEEFSALFDGSLGKYKHKTIKLELKPEAVPKCLRARPVPFAFQKQYDDEFDTLESLGIITRADSADWGTPVVPVLKPNGRIRICGDYKTTLNPYLEKVNHPQPRETELFAQLKGGQLYSKLDLSRGYNQLVLDEESRRLTALSTHRGTYLMNRLPFGITPASGIFQREMENILQGIPNVMIFIDDILITGKSNKEHRQNLRAVLRKLQEAGLKLEKSKCEFFKKELVYLRHTISMDGIKKKQSSVAALLNAPTPTSVTEVRAFCGLANYYAKFVKNMSNTLSPLYRLLRKEVKFSWDAACDEAFRKLKTAIASDNILCHFDPDLPVVLACDASNRGIGAVLSHRINNCCKPIAFASRTLTQAELNYSTIHKEGLAIVFGIKKFYQYLIGRHFTLQTDHKPLVAIFNPSSGIPLMAAGRIQRWAVYLSGFDYSIEYIKSENNLSDVFSRLPVQDVQPPGELDEEKAYLRFMKENFPTRTITHADIRQESRKDIEISTLINAIKNNQLRTTITHKAEFRPYKCKIDELSVERDILMWGSRVVIPSKLREQLLESIHRSHLGMVKTKSVCRAHFWWPNLDQGIEEMIRGCEQCCQLLPDPGKAQLIPWRCEDKPWSRVHMDFAGPIKGVYLLIVVDAFSKWIEVFTTSRPSAEFTLAKLFECIARYGLPDTIVSDNGVQFKNSEFEAFASEFGVKQVFTAPGHPATNGQAESAVKVVKKGVKAILLASPTRDIKQVINQFLFDYRSTPHIPQL